MAAGQGFKTFVTGEVLTAVDVNGYLMQGINVFATTTARNAAITAPAEGQFAFTKDTNSLWYYDGAAWVASGATGDIEGVTAGTGITGGGTSGTVTITNDMATTITAAGDIVVGTGSGTYDNLPIGTTAQVLTADTTVSPYKVKWATPAAGGMTVITSGSFTSGGTALNITSIPQTYKDLILEISNYKPTSDGSFLSLRLNNISAANSYRYTDANSLSAVAFNRTEWDIGNGQDSVTSTQFGRWSFYGYTNSTTWKTIDMFNICNYETDPTTTMYMNRQIGASNITNAITQINVIPPTSTFSAGTYILYGVN